MILEISAKCSDCCSVNIRDGNENIMESIGYVPRFIPGGGGDYLNLSIDMETGQILNWPKNITKENILESIMRG